MKTIIITILVVGIFTIMSCKKTNFERIGFHSQVEKNSSGTCMMNTDKDSGGIILEGKISVSTGDILAELVRPDGKIMYSVRFFAPMELEIDEFFDAQCGTWTLRYKSNDATGHIDMHMTNR